MNLKDQLLWISIRAFEPTHRILRRFNKDS